MITITDDAMARMHSRLGPMPAPGLYQAPTASAMWDGAVLHLTASGVQPSADITAAWPRYARLFQPRRSIQPSIAALLADYASATAPFPPALVASQSTFQARLTICRACILWTETARQNRGSCASVHAPCACRRPWQTSDTCPEAKWPSNEP